MTKPIIIEPDQVLVGQSPDYAGTVSIFGDVVIVLDPACAIAYGKELMRLGQEMLAREQTKTKKSAPQSAALRLIRDRPAALDS